jgi:hypothetical protein
MASKFDPKNPARNIFRYHNGEREVAADPTVLWRGLLSAECDGIGYEEVYSAWFKFITSNKTQRQTGEMTSEEREMTQNPNA